MEKINKEFTRICNKLQHLRILRITNKILPTSQGRDILYTRAVQTRSWRAVVLLSLAPTPIKHT